MPRAVLNQRDVMMFWPVMAVLKQMGLLELAQLLMRASPAPSEMV